MVQLEAIIQPKLLIKSFNMVGIPPRLFSRPMPQPQNIPLFELLLVHVLSKMYVRYMLCYCLTQHREESSRQAILKSDTHIWLRITERKEGIIHCTQMVNPTFPIQSGDHYRAPQVLQMIFSCLYTKLY